MHPVLRKEHARVRKVVRDERKRPENESCDIRYNPQDRTVTRDGMIIDRYRPFLQ